MAARLLKSLLSLTVLAVCASCRSGVAASPEFLYDQSLQLVAQGELDQAEARAQFGEQTFGTQAIWQWRFRLIEAQVLAFRGMNDQALRIIQSPLPSNLRSGDLEIRKALIEALALSRLNRRVEAERHIQLAIQLCPQSKCSLYGEVARFRGVLALGGEDFEQAKLFFSQGLDAARQSKNEYLKASMLLNLGLTALKVAHYDESIDWLTRALETMRSLRMRFDEQKALGNLGWAYLRMGDTERSSYYFQQAADGAREVNARSDLAKWLHAVGVVAEETNELATARDYYQKSLTLAEQSQNEQDTVDALTSLATIAVELKDWNSAERYVSRALALCRASGDRVGELDALLIDAKLAEHKQDKARVLSLIREVVNDKQTETSLRWEAQNQLARYYEALSDPADARVQYQLSLKTFEAARKSVLGEELRLPFLANAAHLEDDYVHFLIEQRSPETALNVADSSRARTLAEALAFSEKSNGSTLSDPRRIAREQSATILFFWLGPRFSYLWIITPTGKRFVDLPDVASVGALVNNYVKELQGSRDPLQVSSSAGSKLYDTLIAPAAREIDSTKRVIVIPDGPLNNLPFDALIVPGPQPHYFIEDVTLSTSSSLRMLELSRPQQHAPGNLLLIGDPLSASRDFPALPNAAQEMKSVQTHFPEVRRTVYSGGAATGEAYLTANPGQFSYIHFVAHATASRVSPLDSAVILSREGPSDDSFKLYARDIVHKPIRADLVTVSTCFGSGSRSYASEGLVGLSWAFLRAGAQNVIAALWQASDASTPQMMDHLYGELSSGAAPDAALRSAKLALLHSDSIYRKPVYWAPFQLYSNQARRSATQPAQKQKSRAALSPAALESVGR